MAFIPPQGNQTVMVDNSNNIVYPASFNRISVNQATVAGNNFTSVPSVIDPENATTTQLPSVASVVNYVADVVEGGSSGLIPTIQKDIRMLGQEKANVGDFHLKNGTISASNVLPINSPFTCIWTASRPAVVYGGSTSTQRKGWVYTFPFGTAGVGMCVAMDDSNIAIYLRNGTSPQISITSNMSSYFDNKPHVYAYIYNSTSVRLLIDGVDKLTAPVADYVSFTPTKPLTITSPDCKVSRIKWFNFDMSDVNAPYTIADYIAGKEQPAIMNTIDSNQLAQLSLDDYSIKVGATQIVPDVSSSNNDATITGTVYGSKDKSIAKMAQLFYQSQQG